MRSLPYEHPPARTRYVPIEALEIRLSVRRSEEIAGTRENPNGSSYPPSTGNMQSVFADGLTVDLAPLSELNGEQIAPPGWTPEMQANKGSQSAFDDLLQRPSSKRTGRRLESSPYLRLESTASDREHRGVASAKTRPLAVRALSRCPRPSRRARPSRRRLSPPSRHASIPPFSKENPNETH